MEKSSQAFEIAQNGDGDAPLGRASGIWKWVTLLGRANLAAFRDERSRLRELRSCTNRRLSL
jgi:hypothetical protein